MAQPDLVPRWYSGPSSLRSSWRRRWYQLGALFAAGCVGAYLAIKLRILEDYQIARLTSFLDPQSDPQVSYQVENSKMAIGSGGLTGKGLNSSGTLGDLGYLPEDRTDFIFSNLAEKIGFVGSLLVLVVFFVLVWRVLHAATVSPDRFGVLIAVGVATMLTFHAHQHRMAMGMMPVTGLPLPFVSYGRSNLLVALMSVGLVQSIVYKRAQVRGEPDLSASARLSHDLPRSLSATLQLRRSRSAFWLRTRAGVTTATFGGRVYALSGRPSTSDKARTRYRRADKRGR